MNGYLVKSKVNENSIFLPAAGFKRGIENEVENIEQERKYGFYWSSNLYEPYTHSAKNFAFTSTSIYDESYSTASRVICCTIRPVSDK
jgi:hypothetical protein